MSKRQIDICFFNSTAFWGGGEKWHYDCAEYLHRTGYNVIIACNKNSVLHQKATENGIPVLSVKISNLSFLNPLKKNKIKKALSELNPKTVIINFPADLKVAAPAAKKAGIKNIIYRRGSAIPIKNRYLNRKIFKKYLTGVIANSEETKKSINKNHEFIDNKKIKVIYNGIDLREFDKKESAPVYNNQNSNEIIIGNAGRFVPQKGQIMLIDIFAKIHETVPEVRLLIAGSGKLEDKLKNYVNQKGLKDKVIFTGFTGNIKDFMMSIDLFFLTSLWEGFGYVIVEAMACEKPVMAFDISSNPEIIENNHTGILIKPFEIDKFANRAVTLINNPKELKKMGQAGRERVEKLFRFEKSIEKLIAFTNL